MLLVSSCVIEYCQHFTMYICTLMYLSSHPPPTHTHTHTHTPTQAMAPVAATLLMHMTPEVSVSCSSLLVELRVQGYTEK